MWFNFKHDCLQGLVLVSFLANKRMLLIAFISIVVCFTSVFSVYAADLPSLYRWMNNPAEEIKRLKDADLRLQKAINNPEFMLKNWVDLPSSPQVRQKKALRLSLREAILLALRYNPNIQNAELDRIVQRYQLRLAQNEFELQYALGGSANFQKSNFSGVGGSQNKNFLLIPDASLKTKVGTEMAMKIDNNITPYNSYSPVLTFSVTQPLLRGFGKKANEAPLLDAIDNEWLNKINLRQAISDQVTQVIGAYRALILSANNLENQKRQLKEARKTYDINEKKINAGQLEPTGNIQQSYQIESLSLLVEQAENDFKTAAQNLLETIGLDPEMRLAVPSDVDVGRIKIPNLEESISLALSHNAQFLALKVQFRADERAYEVAKNQQMWQLNLSANAETGLVSGVTNNNSNTVESVYNGRNTSESATLTLTIPLHELDRRSQLINAKVKLEKDRLNIIAARRALITLMTNTINSIQSQANRYQLAQKQVKLAAQSYALEKKKQQAGIATALDVNNTQNQLIQAQAGLIGAKIAYLNQLSDLQRVLGTTLDHWQIKLRYGE